MKFSQKLTRWELTAGACYFAFQILALPSVLSWLNSRLAVPLSSSAINLVFFFVNFFAVCTIFHRLLKQGICSFRAHPLRCFGFALLGLLLYFAGNAAISTLILQLDPAFFNVNDASITEMAKEDFGITFLGTVLLVPPTEEILYRGLLFGGLYRKSRALDYVLSTFVFAVIHMLAYVGLYPPVTLLFCCLQYLPAGLVLAWIYEKTDTIYTSILVHMAVNWIGLFALR